MGDTPTGKVVGSVVPVLVMAIATFMILNQLKIAPGDRDDHLRRADRRRRSSRWRSPSASAAARSPAACSATPTTRARSSAARSSSDMRVGKERGQAMQANARTPDTNGGPAAVAPARSIARHRPLDEPQTQEAPMATTERRRPQLARPGSARLERRQDRQDRGDLPRRRDRRPGVGAGDDRPVRHQAVVRPDRGRDASRRRDQRPVREGDRSRTPRRIDPDGALSQEEDALYRHYGRG